MQRCLELAQLAAGHTAPNPMVGAVLVHAGRIIGEGYHELYGQAHAEVNCIRSVKEEDRALIPESTIYVSLEPCAHHGKTPPCADLIIASRIPRVVVGCRDPFPQVNGKGIEKLMAAGIAVELGVMEKECVELNRRFFTFNTLHRPYIVLKWAQSVNGKIAGGTETDRVMGTEDRGESPDGRGTHGGRLHISNEYTNRLVHRWRSEEAAILVGTNTALADDPSLTVRLWKGPDPIRLVIDKTLRLPLTLKLFDGQVRTIVFNTVRREERGNIHYYKLEPEGSLVRQIVEALYHEKILSVLVEGGAGLLQSFIDEGCWDEARVITNQDLQVPGGLGAPEIGAAQMVFNERLFSDTIAYMRKQ